LPFQFSLIHSWISFEREKLRFTPPHPTPHQQHAAQGGDKGQTKLGHVYHRLNMDALRTDANYSHRPAEGDSAATAATATACVSISR
jgi:hypothetical protein